MEDKKTIVNSWNEWDPLKHVIVGRANGTCIPAPEPAIDAKVPDFPVSGADLIATGMKPGPDLGKKLAQLKQQWKAGNFKASKEDLLNTSKE